MTDMLYKATKYMNAKDAMTSWGGKTKKRERQDDPHQGNKPLKKTIVVQTNKPLWKAMNHLEAAEWLVL